VPFGQLNAISTAPTATVSTFCPGAIRAGIILVGQASPAGVVVQHLRVGDRRMRNRPRLDLVIAPAGLPAIRTVAAISPDFEFLERVALTHVELFGLDAEALENVARGKLRARAQVREIERLPASCSIDMIPESARTTRCISSLNSLAM